MQFCLGKLTDKFVRRLGSSGGHDFKIVEQIRDRRVIAALPIRKFVIPTRREAARRNLLFAGSIDAASDQQIPRRLRRFGMTK